MLDENPVSSEKGEEKKVTEDTTTWKIIVHAFKTSPAAYVDEKIKEREVDPKEDPLFQGNYVVLKRKFKTYKIVHFINIFFTVMMYWTLLSGVIATALATFNLDLPSVVGILILSFGGVAIPGFTITSILKSSLYLDVDNSKTFCLGIIAAKAEAKEMTLAK